MLSFANAAFDYEPYPICRITNAIANDEYDALATSYPDISLFAYKPKLGEKYSLSERNNGDAYARFINATPAWKRVHEYLKSARFIEETLAFLKERHVDLDLGEFAIVPTRGKRRQSLASRLSNRAEISARFEFSIMSGQGGHIRPHTDEPRKLVTMVISMIAANEWNEAWGGGTAVCLPKDRSRIFNRANAYMEFDQVDTLRTYPFEPNQCVLFIKTYNSWHHVLPLNAPAGAAHRKTVTINIERLA